MPAAPVQTYRYPSPSGIEVRDGRTRLRLATSGGVEASPYFFEGALTAPRRVADLLLALTEVVGARFYTPPNMLARILREADPVVTSDGERLRFEAFSSCCSTHARVDLLPAAFEGTLRQRGTTNVDFNPAMRTALASLREDEPVRLRVGQEQVELDRAGDRLVEKKVPLPQRWVKGFVEIQSYQSRLELWREIPGPEALRFLRSLPRGRTDPRNLFYAIPAPRGLRLSRRESADGVPLNCLQRLRSLARAAGHARALRVRKVNGTGVSSWELELEEARYTVLLSPDASRGFSGEGQVLRDLANPAGEALAPRVRAGLHWQGRIRPEALARELDAEPDQVRAALSLLGSQGLVGFDAEEQVWFHRELPFDLSAARAAHPRSAGARKLVSQGQVRIDSRDGSSIEGRVRSDRVNDLEHLVRLSPEGDRCTCPWHARHQGARGPCRHILALGLAASRN